MAQIFRKHRGTFVRDVLISDIEKYTLIIRIPKAPGLPDSDYAKPLTENIPGIPGNTDPLIVGWDGFTDTETGEPLALTPENLEQVLADVPIAGGIWRTINGLLDDARTGVLLAKNSKAPSLIS
jgi:hypothetical protein